MIDYCAVSMDPQKLPQPEATAKRMRALGDQVRRHRQAMRPRVTQEDLAQRAGISRPEVSRIERGIARPTITMLWCIADGLGCRIHDLLDD